MAVSAEEEWAMSWSAEVVAILQAGYVMLEIPEIDRVVAKAPMGSPIREAFPGTAGTVTFSRGIVRSWQPAMG
jgi:hypothetical protein